MSKTYCCSQEGPINALAVSKDFNHVCIVGRNVFKIYHIQGDQFEEVYNLRTSLGTPKQLGACFSCNDVAWSPTDESYLAAAATNGHVCVWNLSKMGKAVQEQDYQEHRRTVNKVNFHVSEPFTLISGSQDGTMRYFDIRSPTAVAIFYSNTESVRDVQFSPHNACIFTSVSENGSVQLWDVRRPDRYQQQYTAHSGPIFACDWHPEMTWLATASRDKTIKVWDLTHKPTLEYTISSIASIGHVKWRPQKKYHVSSCALVIDSSVNVWDVRRPFIPYATFNEHKDISTGIAWRGDPDSFLTAGRDCNLYHHAFVDADRPSDRANSQAISLNGRGELLFSQKIIATGNNGTGKSTMSIIRKTSTTIPPDYFHQTVSYLQCYPKNVVPNDDSKALCSLAENYVLSGRSLSEMCDHNAAVAMECDKSPISTVWKIVKTMYGEEFLQNSELPFRNRENSLTGLVTSMVGKDHLMPDQNSKDGDTPGAQFSDETENEDQVDNIAIINNSFPYFNYKTGLSKGDFPFRENELDMEFDDFRSNFRSFQPFQDQSDWTLPNEAFPIRHEIMDRSPPADQFPNQNLPEIQDDTLPVVMSVHEPPTGLLTVKILPKRTAWDPGNILVEALKHHANFGDVQTPVCILMVLGEHRKYLVDLDENLQEHWLISYIDLLSRYQLWNVVTQVIKLSWVPSVSHLSQQSTRINTNCSKCNKSLQRIGWLCDKCHSSEYALCSVCHQVVKGLYVWCQGCSHGGHLGHIQQWMSKNNVCPTGCGHLCEYK